MYFTNFFNSIFSVFFFHCKQFFFNIMLKYYKCNCSKFKSNSNAKVGNGIDPKKNINNFNYFSESKLVNGNNNIKSFTNLKSNNCVNVKLNSLLDECENVNLNVCKRIEKKITDLTWIKIGLWNVQRLNKQQLNERYVKLEFLRDTLNEVKFDILFLVDIDDGKDVVHLNGFNKINIGRNCLFIKNNIHINFYESKNIFYDPISKLAFVYITPNINDNVFKNNIKYLCLNGYCLIGDINLKSNKWLNSYVNKFCGEDSLQCGFVNCPFINNVMSVAGPSDHRFVSGYVKCIISHSLSLKVKEISEEHSLNCIEDICAGKVPKFEPKLVVQRGLVTLNDRENSINHMISDFLSNNVRKIYKRYNYLWLGNKKEPFLGTSVPKCVIDSFCKHYFENKDKKYKSADLLLDIPDDYFDNMVVKKTKSKALNSEFLSLSNITNSLNKIWTREGANRKLIFNNILTIANKLKRSLDANTFFLQKEKYLSDCNSVRVIVIIPSIIKMFESLVFDPIVDYISSYLNRNVLYQFGGIRKGSCYYAMQSIRVKMNIEKSNSLLFVDLSKGYDSILFNILDDFINYYIDDGNVKKLLLTWSYLASNLNIIMNNYKIRKERGIAMGLSLSPIVFIFYVDRALSKVDKSKLIMYIDDLTVILKENQDAINNVTYVNNVFNCLKNVGLFINEDKTKLLSQCAAVVKQFDNKYKIVTDDVFLGCKLMINGDGRIVNDTRFYNLKGFRVYAVPYWTTFFVKRMIHNSALEAKLRYRCFMWSINNTEVINGIWRTNWRFFKSCSGKYSYVQMSYSVFNLFRYCIDTLDCINWKSRIAKNEDINVINNEVINKISTKGIPQLDNVFRDIKIDWEIIADTDWEFTKKFCDKLWDSFKGKLLDRYIDNKIADGDTVFPNIKKYVKSTLYNHFLSIQKIVFKHVGFKNKLKQLYSLIIVNACGEFAKIIIDEFKTEQFPNHIYSDIFKLCRNLDRKFWYIENLDNNTWELIYKDECEKTWTAIDNILKLEQLTHMKVIKNENWEIKIDKSAPEIYIDGAYNNCTKKAGYGIYIDRKDPIIDKIKISGLVPDVDVAKELAHLSGELWGAIEALKWCVNHDISVCNLIYDYEGVRNFALNIWYSSIHFIRNVYMPAMNNLKNKVSVRFIHVSSHSNCKGNNIADSLAKKIVNIDKKNVVNDLNVNNTKCVNKKQISWLKYNYRLIFKILTVDEMMLINNNLNSLNPEELFFTLKLKVCSIEDLLNRMCELLDYENLDPVMDNYFDLYFE